MKLFTRSLLVGALCTTAILFSPAADIRPHAQAPPATQHLLKLDGLLRADVQRNGGGSEQRVLIRIKNGNGDKEVVRKQLESLGVPAVDEFDSGDTLSLTVPAKALEGLARSPRVLSISTDAVVRTHGLLGGLVGTATGLVGGLVETTTQVLTSTVGSVLKTVVNVIDPSMDTGGQPVPPAVLRATLGLQDASSGKGVTVAVIDSGLEMSDEFQGR